MDKDEEDSTFYDDMISTTVGGQRTKGRGRRRGRVHTPLL